MAKAYEGSRKRLPSNPNIQHLRKQAKALLGALKRGDPAAVARLQSAIAGTPKRLQLSVAQRVIAKEYGFSSWPRLVAELGRRQRAGGAVHTHGAGPSIRCPVVFADVALLPGSVHELPPDHKLAEPSPGRAGSLVFIAVGASNGVATVGSIGLVADSVHGGAGRAPRLSCLYRGRVLQVDVTDGIQSAHVAILHEPTSGPACDLAAARTLAVARRYVRAIGLGRQTAAQLGVGLDPARLSDTLAFLCHGDVPRHLLKTLEPQQRLEIIAACLTQMLELNAAREGAADGTDAIPAPARLIVVEERDGKLIGQHFPVRAGVNEVGRALSSDVCLPLESVSRKHCAVLCLDGAFQVLDSGSTNGVFVNDNREHNTAVLRDRDRIRIGSATLQLVVGGTSALGAPDNGRGPECSRV